jgi:ABC-2 type transport system ATP-binding protein
MLVGRLRAIPERDLATRVSKLIELFQLFDARYKTMSAFSKGMRQRVLLAAALIHDPDLLVLDEPFSGLDVNAALLFRALLTQLAARGRMILFSTHRFDMVEKLCSRVVMLAGGRLVAEHAVTDFDRTGPNSLEDRFIRVTAPPDFAPVAAQILNAIHAR